MANQVTDETFQKEVLESDTLVLVDFWAEWCSPCRMLEPIIEELETEMKGKVKIVKMDVDANSQTSSYYQVMSIPNVKLFKNGQIVENLVGVQPKENYVDAINKHSA